MERCGHCGLTEAERELMDGIWFVAQLMFGEYAGEGPDDLDCRNCAEHKLGRCYKTWRGPEVVEECLLGHVMKLFPDIGSSMPPVCEN